MKTLDSLMVNATEYNLLRYAAGQNICCPACGAIMDCRKTVIATVYGTPKGKAEKIASQYVQCDKCWEERKHHLENGVKAAQAKMPDAKIRVELVDGRDARFNDLE
jgi:hypothetical protein